MSDYRDWKHLMITEAILGNEDRNRTFCMHSHGFLGNKTGTWKAWVYTDTINWNMHTLLKFTLEYTNMILWRWSER